MKFIDRLISAISMAVLLNYEENPWSTSFIIAFWACIAFTFMAIFDHRSLIISVLCAVAMVVNIVTTPENYQ